MKLCLGTAQFGLDYGINNTSGKIPKEKVIKILNLAYDNEIIMIDTASAYGNSETVLGEGIACTGKKFQIITKYPADTELSPFQWIDTSLSRLKIEKVYGYLFHNYSIFQKHPEYCEDFVKIKQIGKCEKIGFSLYYPSEAKYIIENNIPCDIVQIPYNIFDQRFKEVFHELKSRSIEIHVRSVFLQGLFFINSEDLPSYFTPIRNKLQELHTWSERKSIDISTVCLKFASINKYIDKIVIGVDSLDNLKENINNYNMIPSFDMDINWIETLEVIDEQMILPFNWKVKSL